MRGLTKAQNRVARTNPDAARLLSHAAEVNGCWEWYGAKNASGYGYMAFQGKTWKAHRVSYAIFCGDIPDGILVCHHCDNPSCVNPSHLFLGHRSTNMQDMVRKGRGRSQISSKQDHFKNGPLFGEKSSGTKLSEDEVRAIIVHAVAGELTKTMAARYSVSRFTIQAILNGSTWKHIPRPAGLPRPVGVYSTAGRLALSSKPGDGE